MSPTPLSPADPAWIRTADTGYAALLWLFPGSYRNEFGELMRQAFRDRCREVARGERTAWQCFALELAPDLIATVGRENMQTTFGVMRPRTAFLLVALIASSGVYLFGESLGLRIFEGTRSAFRGVVNHMISKPMIKAANRRVYSVAEPLAAEDNPESKALAAYLYRTTVPLDRAQWAADTERSEQLAGEALAGEPGEATLGLLATMCSWTKCDPDPIVRRILATNPDNGFGWVREYYLAERAKDVPRMRRALAIFARSKYYDAYEARINAALLASAERLAPGNQKTMDRIAGRLPSGQGWHKFANLCSPSPYSQSHFGITAADIESAREDCLKAGRLLAASTTRLAAKAGWELVTDHSLDPTERATAHARIGELKELDDRLVTDEDGERDFDRVGEMWIATYGKGLGEIPSIRWWLASQSPEHTERVPGDQASDNQPQAQPASN